jgi:type VI secretion system protein ImpA
MASPAVLDLDALLRAIPGDNPCGEDLRQDLSPTPAYYQIKDVRTAARAAERQGEFEAVVSKAEAGVWRPIVVTAGSVLENRTKDLEIVAWLIEALARTDGFAGLRDGFRLARELVERFWDGLYPSPDEDGIETRVAPLTGLNGAGADGTLIAPISRIPITRGSSVDPVAAWSCQQAVEISRLADAARQERIKNGAVSMELVQTAVRETPVEFFVALVEDIGAALAELAALGAVLDARCGGDAPPTSAIRGALQGALDMVRLIAGDVLPVDSAAPEAAAGADGVDASAAPAPAAAARAAGPMQTRDDALRALSQVADFFRRTEPHSPLSSLIERTVRWGRLSLPELLMELIPDASARETFGRLTGVDFPSSES